MRSRIAFGVLLLSSVGWRVFSVAAGWLLVGAGAAAQATWQVPERGAVEYRRTATAARISAVVRSKSAAAGAECAASMPERFVPSVLPAPFVCAGELTKDRRSLTGAVRDLRDVLRAVACDLGGSGGRFESVVPYGDVTVSGGWRRSDSDASQALRGSVRLRRPRGDLLRAFCVRSGGGDIEIMRTVDTERGLVTRFAGSIDLVVEVGERQFRRIVVEDAWEQVATRDSGDLDFRLRVARAIENGAKFVRAAIEKDRSYLDGRVDENRSYGSGRLALALLTLLAAHVPSDDAVVAAGFDALRRRRLVDAYTLAAALMAYGKLAVDPDRRARGGLTERETKAAQKWLDRLLGCVDPRGQPLDLLRFNYVRGPRYDTSVQQYGLLGLRAAQACGLTVDASAFAAAARQLLAVQCPPSGRLGYDVTTPDDARRAEDTATASRSVRASCRGFAYVHPDEPPFGSMTAAGVSGLLLARDGLAAAGARKDRKLDRAIAQAIDDGFAWLSRELSLRCNPGFGERGRFHWYYYLYCLERSCHLADIAWLDGRDWYYEGALQLIAEQQRSGAFACGCAADMQIDATCFAILFLSKANARAAVTRGQ